MQSKPYRFTPFVGGSFWGSVKAEPFLYICDYVMRHMFDIPPGVKAVYLTLHTRGGKNRHRLSKGRTLKTCSWSIELSHPFLSNITPPFNVSRTIERLAKKHKVESVYVSCEYE